MCGTLTDAEYATERAALQDHVIEEPFRDRREQRHHAERHRGDGDIMRVEDARQRDQDADRHQRLPTMIEGHPEPGLQRALGTHQPCISRSAVMPPRITDRIEARPESAVSLGGGMARGHIHEESRTSRA
jgi:hypothetical protein